MDAITYADDLFLGDRGKAAQFQRTVEGGANLKMGCLRIQLGDLGTESLLQRGVAAGGLVDDAHRVTPRVGIPRSPGSAGAAVGSAGARRAAGPAPRQAPGPRLPGARGSRR
ncbi:hypothetical protein SALBM311S_08166 [Streptomyces alboniger]